MFTKITNKKAFAFALLFPLLVGAVSSLLSGNAMQNFNDLNKPPFAPHATVFPIVWTILFLLMGAASYLIYVSKSNSVERGNALSLYVIQLMVNFFWSFFFFNLKWYFFAFLWLLLLWGLIAATILSFSKISKKAALLLLPYLLWVTFAGILNFAIVVLN